MKKYSDSGREEFLKKFHAAESNAKIASAGYMLKLARSFFSLREYSSCLRRSYDCLFDTARALLARKLISRDEDVLIIGEFRKVFVEGEGFDPEFARYLDEAWPGRSEHEIAAGLADSAEKAESQMNRATLLLTAAERYLATKS